MRIWTRNTAFSLHILRLTLADLRLADRHTVYLRFAQYPTKFVCPPLVSRNTWYVEPNICLNFSDPRESFLQHQEYGHLEVAYRFGTGHDGEGPKFIFEKTEELQVRGFVLNKFVKIYVNKLETFITIKLISLNSSFVQCCETGTLGTVTFCLSGTGPITVSVPEPDV